MARPAAQTVVRLRTGLVALSGSLERDEATGKVYTLKIYETEKEPCVCHEPAGKVVSDGKTYLKVAVDGGYLRLKEIQLTGKKRMRIEDFLRGFRMPENLLMR